MIYDDIDLAGFCAPEKPNVRAPFRIAGHAAASDGTVAIIIPIGKRTLPECPVEYIADVMREWLAVPMTHSMRRQALAEQIRRKRKPLAILGRQIYPLHLKRVLSVMTGPRVFFGLHGPYLCIRCGEALGVIMAQDIASNRPGPGGDLRVASIPRSAGAAAKRPAAKPKRKRAVARSA